MTKYLFCQSYYQVWAVQHVGSRKTKKNYTKFKPINDLLLFFVKNFHRKWCFFEKIVEIRYSYFRETMWWKTHLFQKMLHCTVLCLIFVDTFLFKRRWETITLTYCILLRHKKGGKLNFNFKCDFLVTLDMQSIINSLCAHFIYVLKNFISSADI